MQILPPKGIQDLPRKKGREVTHLRPKIQICLIDDEPQKKLVLTLRSHGYNVTKLDDIKQLNDVCEYPIIVIDIMGIGKDFGSHSQGWHVVSQLRKRWPLKHIIAYSAGDWDVSYSSYMKHLDNYLRKDAPIEEWVSLLDAGISATGDPAIYWKRCRDLLLEQEIRTSHVAKLEDAFVRDVFSGKGKRMDRLWNKLERDSQYADIIPLLKPAISMALGSLSLLADVTALLPNK